MLVAVVYSRFLAARVLRLGSWQPSGIVTVNHQYKFGNGVVCCDVTTSPQSSSSPRVICHWAGQLPSRALPHGPWLSLELCGIQPGSEYLLTSVTNVRFGFLRDFPPELDGASGHFESWVSLVMGQMLSVSSQNVHGLVHFDVLADQLQTAPGSPLPGGSASLLRNLCW